MNRLICLLLGAACVLPACADSKAEVLSPGEFSEMIATNHVTLLDVRTADEYAQGHLNGAVNIDWLRGEEFRTEAASLPTDKPVALYCRSGRRSAEAAKYLASKGYTVTDMKGGIMAWIEAGLPTVVYDFDTFTTDAGRKVEITFIKHGTLMMRIGDYVVHIDPVSMFGTDYATMPKADLVVVTHEHGDHYDAKAIDAVSTPNTLFVSNGRVAELSQRSVAMKPGEIRYVDKVDFYITATMACNLENNQKFHPRGRDIGVIFDVDGLRIYVAGDIEDIPELAELKNIDVAFLPVNQPYTMTPDQCVHAIEMLGAKVVYPYHYGKTDLAPLVKRYAGTDVDLRIRQLQ